jgi:hypothetical protein
LGKKWRAPKTRVVKALVDCGASESIITKQAAKALKRKINPKVQNWTIAAGKLDTAAQTRKTEFSFPELHANKTIRKSLHIVDKDLVRYDMIIGRNLMVKLGLNAKGSDLSIEWDDAASHGAAWNLLSMTPICTALERWLVYRLSLIQKVVMIKYEPLVVITNSRETVRAR